MLDVPTLFEIMEKWDTYIRKQLPPTAMWYPPITSEWSKEILSAAQPGKNRNIALLMRLRKLSKLIGMEYKSPHKYRHGHAVYALLHSKTMADYKAISQNLMHGDITVTDSTYAWLNENDVKDRIAHLTNIAQTSIQQSDELKTFLCNLSKPELIEAMLQSAHLIAEP